MKTLAAILAGAALVLTGATAATARSAEENEARLARMLEGRTAGEPVSCIVALNSNRIEVIENVAIVYDAGETIYVARPSNPKSLGRNDVVVLERYTTGAVFLDEFVPYRRS